jgi:hypothetical protein
MAQDQFEHLAPGLTAPGGEFFAITPSNSVDFTLPTRGVYVGVTGDVVAVDLQDNAVTFTAVQAGCILPIRAKRINSTDTSATGLVGLR